MAKYLSTNNEINKKLIASDIFFENLICKCGDIRIEIKSNYFSSLVNSILSQQLSNKVSTVIFNRMNILMKYEINPKNILALDDKCLREIGISYSKIGYLKSLAHAILEDELNLEGLSAFDDNEVVRKLISIKGIGIWTAEMFLIFSLGRTDIFSVNDGGLRRAIKWLYKTDLDLKSSELLDISKKWSPYRTYASLYLWKAIDKGLIKNE